MGNKLIKILLLKKDTFDNRYVKLLRDIETSTTTATISDDVQVHVCNGTSDYTLTLPTAVEGKVIQIINKNTATVTLSGTISSISATSVLYSGESIDLIYDGTEWI